MSLTSGTVETTQGVQANPRLAAFDKPGRLMALDVFRGLTIAAMILVNNAGAGGAYPPLEHARWDGLTPTDLVFPFFLLIVGVAIPYSFGNRREGGAGWLALIFRIARRAVVIFAIGIALNGFPSYKWETIRIPGVLQRIALCYLVASIVDLVAGVRIKAGLIVVLLAGYYAAMVFGTFLGHEKGDLSEAGNLAAIVDRLVLPGHIYRPNYDPEGLLSTIPAVATTLIGVLAGRWLRSGRSRFEIDAGLFVAGWSAVVAGWIWSAGFPINKALWTSSYTLVTAGLGLQLLAVCYWIVDLHGRRRWARPLAIFGTNAIAAYVLAGLLARLLGMIAWQDGDRKLGVKTWIAEQLGRLHVAPHAGSLIFAATFVLVCYAPIYLMHRNRFYLKA